jgi:hypothetical protein
VRIGESFIIILVLNSRQKLCSVLFPKSLGCTRGKFSRAVKNLLENQQRQWNPISKKVSPWIDVRSMDKIYGDKWWSFW